MAEWTLTVYGKALAELPTGVANKWESTLKADRALILSRLLAKIPNEEQFGNRLADASSDRFEGFLASVGTDWELTDILMKQRVKLARKYDDWLAGITEAFAQGGTFDVNVTAKKGKLEALRYPMGMVGMKSLDKWRCASLVALGLGGDTRIARYIASPDTLTGTIVPALKAPYNVYDRSMVVASLVKYGTLLQYADEAGIDKTTLLSSINDILTEVAGHKITASTLTIVASWDVTNGVKVITHYVPP